MRSIQPRRDFIKRLLALPLLGAPSLAIAPVLGRYELNVFPVAGFAFHDGPEVIGRLKPGDPVTLVAEPENRHDARAIRIEALGRHIGYVPRSENGPLSRLLAQGASLGARVMAVRANSAPWEAVTVAVSVNLPRVG